MWHASMWHAARAALVVAKPRKNARKPRRARASKKSWHDVRKGEFDRAVAAADVTAAAKPPGESPLPSKAARSLMLPVIAMAAIALLLELFGPKGHER